MAWSGHLGGCARVDGEGLPAGGEIEPATREKDRHQASALHLTTCQRVTGILVPGNSRENQLHFFPLDLEKLNSISRLLLETRD